MGAAFMLVNFWGDNDGVRGVDGVKEDLGEREEKERMVRITRKKRCKRKKKENRDGSKTAGESHRGDEDARQYKDCKEAKEAPHDEVILEEEDEENAVVEDCADKDGAGGREADGKWDEKMECVDVDNAEVGDDVNGAAGAEDGKPVEDASDNEVE
ncbi:hypothetical protein MTO96_045907 [Rhipicephalus appendiculatus]